MLIWMNQGPTLQGDYLSLTITEGKPELSFNLGKQTRPVRITSKVILSILFIQCSKLQFYFLRFLLPIFYFDFQTRIDDGKWHRLRILRKRRIGILQVDKSKPSRGRSEEGASMLNTDGKIWFGV